ncbi:uncharacterized protein LOC122672604 [Telopea speciosissima]|uniref:uncharacterized protein LOC122672604 n=1 Tax=Telopea speciosissima TaxID=54955 RepID=UPI001CC36880|nr:uncharacterized protein LOC122672604 [Telopea speciosissima]
MAEKQADDDDDEEFGDFKFVSPSSNEPLYVSQDNGVEDEWGDFMDNFSQKQDFFGNQLIFQPFNGYTQTVNHTNPPQSQQSFDLFGDFSDHSPKATVLKLNHVETENNSASPVAEKRWEKPQGALPLSIFGEEEVESDSNNPSFNDTPDPFPVKKSPSPVKNEVKFGPGLRLNDIIVNLYSQADQIKIENGSNWNLVDGDDNGWKFNDAFSQNKVGDRESAVKEFEWEQQEEQQLTNNLKVSDRQSENSEGTLHKSGLSNVGLDSGDIFANSDWFSHKSAGLYNGFGLSTSMATQNGSISVSLTQANQNVNGNELNSKSGDGKINADDNFWDFKDAVSESENVNFSSGKKEEKMVADIPDADMKVLAFDGEVQGNGKWHGDHQESLSLPFFSNGKLDADDSLCGKDVSSHKPANYVRNSTYGQSFGPNVSLTDFIFTLYSQAGEIPAVNSTKGPTGDELSSAQVGVNSDLMNGEDDFDDNSWEFKDAFSETKADDEFNLIQVGVRFANSKPTEAQVSLNCDLMNGEDDFDESSWEFKDASSETKTEGRSYVFNPSNTDIRFLSESKLKNFVDFYSRLKEESCSVALHHLDCLKEAQKVAVLSGNDVKAMAFHEEIQAAYKKLHKEDMISEEAYSKELSTRKICVNEFMNDPTFQVVESEYDLSKRISLAENDLNSAIELFKHAILILKILSLGSVEEQSKYITNWSKIISACAQELKHGALIWKQSLLQTIHKKMLSQLQGQRYFLALAEIYRVVEILRASATLYKPWILSNLEDPSIIFALLEECKTVWSESGLEEAVRSIPDPVSIGYDGTVMALLDSIKSIHDLDVLALQNRVFSQKESICQLSGLSCAVVPDMKVVVWDGEHYFLILANLWVNRISCDPPRTPHLRISYDDC